MSEAPVETPEATDPERVAAPRGGPSGGGVLSWFTNDWPLKLLALVLAVLTWQLVRERLDTKATATVGVFVTDVPADVVVVGLEERKVTVTLQGPRAEVERARSDLETSGEVRVRMPPPAADRDEGSTKPLYRIEDFIWPFDNPDLVKEVTPGIVLAWYRVSHRTVSVEAPAVVELKQESKVGALEPAPGSPSLDTQTAKVRGPKRVVDALHKLQPDPVDPAAWLATDPDLATPWSWTSGFDLWRGKDPLRAPSVLSIDPPVARGKLKVRAVAVPRLLEDDLQVVLPGDSQALEGWRILVDGGPEYDKTTRRIRLTLKGEKKALDEMEANPGAWGFVAQVPPPPGPGEAVENVAVPVRLLVFGPTPSGKPLGGGVVLDGSPTVSVTLRRK